MRLAGAATPTADPAAALRARYAALGPQLGHSPLQQDLLLESSEGTHDARGDTYAIVKYPIATVSDAFADPGHWCDALILHLNVKYCALGTHGGHPSLTVAIGRKVFQPVESSFRVEFDFGNVASRPDYLQVTLNAARGPLGTADYRIGLEAVGVGADRTFVHLSYSYTYGMEARIALQAYLATAGLGKVGFTAEPAVAGRQPQYVGGARGTVERNTMRYFLALEAYLDALSIPAPARFEHSLEHWFNATERYPRQLHEIDWQGYADLKRREHQRQQLPLTPEPVTSKRPSARDANPPG